MKGARQQVFGVDAALRVIFFFIRQFHGQAPWQKKMEEDIPLFSEWVWYAHTQFVGEYRSSYVKISNFDTVQMFWRLWNNIPSVNRIFSGREYGVIQDQIIVGYSIFRNGILPEWEDVNNANGAEWWCRGALIPLSVENLWMEICILLIGNYMPDQVTGVRLIYKNNRSNKANFKMEIWFSRSGEGDEVKHSVLRTLQEHLKYKDLSFMFSVHSDAAEPAKRRVSRW